jgi:type IV pilus assembly protein PilC
MDYAYLGYTTDRKIVRGKVAAITEQAASEMLINFGYNIVSLKPIASFVPKNVVLFQGKVKAEEIVSFSRQLALLLESGVGIIQSLELLGDQTTDKQMKSVLTNLINDLRGGRSLSDAMGKYPNVFTIIYSKMVGVGERTGALDAVLRNLANYIEQQARSAGKVKTALAYPIVVGILGIVVGAVLIGFVLPPIVNLFKGLGGDLPLPTKMLIALSEFMQANGVVVLISLLIAVIAMFIMMRTKQGKFTWDTIRLKLPYLGRLMHVTELAKMCRNMSLLFKAGIPLNEIITLSAQACGNKVVSRDLMEVGQETLKGKGFSEPMRARKSFLPLMVELIRVGEETGNLEETLVMIAQNYEQEQETRTQRMLAMIEPVMTIVMGVFVGFLALSIFMPIYSSLGLVGGQK